MQPLYSMMEAYMDLPPWATSSVHSILSHIIDVINLDGIILQPKLEQEILENIYFGLLIAVK